MTIEIAVLVSVISIGITIYTTISNRAKTIRGEAQVEATQMTAVMVKLESIGTSIIELKTDFKNSRIDIQEIKERLVLVENKVDSAHTRIDKIKGSPV